jgi:hypothetical protein
MPSVYQHLRQAVHNERFFGSVKALQPDSTDWAVTALFYTTLHLVTAVLHRLGCSDADVNRHAKRKNELAHKLPNEGQLYDDYRDLQDDSEGARYRCVGFSMQQVSDLETEQSARVKATVKALLP